MDIVGVGAFLIFYAIILAFGIFIARRKNANTSEDFILAGKNIGFVVGIFTLVATEVGGAFVNGTAEEVYKTGFLWALAPIGYSLSMTINGLFFVARVRQENCITLIDILQKVTTKSKYSLHDINTSSQLLLYRLMVQLLED